MKREFDFIFKLDAQDVNHVMEKKAEHAAIRIQRNFRERKQRRAYLEAQRAGYILNQDPEPTEKDLKRIEIKKLALQDKLKYHQGLEKNQDTFKAKVTEGQKKELVKKLNNIWRHSRSEEVDFFYEEVYDKFLPKNLQFNEAYRVNEQKRLEANQQLMTSAIMMDYLLFLE